MKKERRASQPAFLPLYSSKVWFITKKSNDIWWSAKEGNREDLLNEYLTYGGIPQVVTMDEIERKVEYLKNLFTHTYIRDIKERYEIKKDDDWRWW